MTSAPTARKRARFSLPATRRSLRLVGDEYHCDGLALVVRTQEPRPARWTADTNGSQVGDPWWTWDIFRKGKRIASTTAVPSAALDLAESLERTRLSLAGTAA